MIPNAQIRIDKDRLWQDLEQMGAVGATPTGGVRRLALSIEDKLGRDLFVRWCVDAGYGVRNDARGKLF